jgi:hypothetical protein
VKLMGEVDGYTAGIAVAVERRGEATDEISRNLEQVAAA